MSKVEQLLAELGLELSVLPSSAGSYGSFYKIGNLLLLSGLGPCDAQDVLPKGGLGAGQDIVQVVEDAEGIAMQLLAAAQAAIRDLGNVAGGVKVLGLVVVPPHSPIPQK